MTSATTGWTRSAGCVPAEMAWARRESAIELNSALHECLPRRFAQAWASLYVPAKPLKQFNDAELSRIDQALHRWEIQPNGTEGFRKAEVTAGGVSTSELSSQTMESRRVPGLYFIGEVVDVTGQLGGYNFQWAWASGFVIAQGI